MDSKDIRNLQEAYIGVYDEDYKPWDFGPKQKAQAKFTELAQKKAEGNSVPGTATRANAIASVARDMRTTLDKNSASTGTNPAKQGLQPATQRHTVAALRGAGGGMTASKVYDVKPLKPKAPTKRVIKSSYEKDIYDVILEYLLDEGYADTQESALAIMGNMSEDWRDSIVEEKKPLPIGKMKRKEMELMGKADKALGPALRTPMNSPERNAALRTSERASTISDVRRSISTRGGKQQYPMPEVGRYKPEEDEEDYKQYSSGETTAQRARRDPEFRTKMIKARMKTMESYDLYDTILEYLINEGYADTVENAESIMVNMSEDWRDSIVEEQKPLPIGKMTKQAERKAFYHNIDHEPWSYYTDTNRQLRKMSEVGGKKVKKAAEKGRELANDVDNRLYRKYAPSSSS